jgi:outer membrane protein OmpA-like peptidoglycan-associated protein
MNAPLFFTLLLLSSSVIAQPELLEITPNTSRCDVLKALNGNNDRLPAECRPCPEGECKSFHENQINQPPKRAVLKNVSFANNSDQLTESAEETLRNIAQAMNATVDESYHIQGHTNHTGAYDLNMRLSERRARTVTNFLIQQGVSQQRLIAEGFGYNQPYTDDPKDGINRRVEFVNNRELKQ